MTEPAPWGTVATLGPDTPDGDGTLDAVESDYMGGDAHQADEGHAGTLSPIASVWPRHCNELAKSFGAHSYKQ